MSTTLQMLGGEGARLQNKGSERADGGGDGNGSTAPSGYHPPNPLLVAIVEAAETLKALSDKGQLKAEDVAGARALIALRADKVGLGVSVTQGYGLVVARQPGSASGWSPPLPLKVDGFSLGAVAGYSEQRTVVTLGSDAEAAVFLADKRSLKMGLDLGLSLGKKVNHAASVAHDAAMKPSGAAAAGGGGGAQPRTRAFTISKGFIVDVSLKGTSLEPDADDIAAAYGEGVTPADVLTGRVRPPRQAQLLYAALAKVEAGGGGGDGENGGGGGNDGGNGAQA